jgi:hypothetical protein
MEMGGTVQFDRRAHHLTSFRCAQPPLSMPWRGAKSAGFGVRFELEMRGTVLFD